MIAKIRKSIAGGLLGTIAMTVILLGAPIVGLARLSPPEMLSSMFGVPILDGWLMHFMIGIIFAMMYVFAISRILKNVPSMIWKGIIFGVFAFVFGQIMISVLGALFTEAPSMAGSMVQTMMASILGHLTFGIVVAVYAHK